MASRISLRRAADSSCAPPLRLLLSLGSAMLASGAVSLCIPNPAQASGATGYQEIAGTVSGTDGNALPNIYVQAGTGEGHSAPCAPYPEPPAPVAQLVRTGAKGEFAMAIGVTEGICSEYLIRALDESGRCPEFLTVALARVYDWLPITMQCTGTGPPVEPPKEEPPKPPPQPPPPPPPAPPAIASEPMFRAGPIRGYPLETPIEVEHVKPVEELSKAEKAGWRLATGIFTAAQYGCELWNGPPGVIGIATWVAFHPTFIVTAGARAVPIILGSQALCVIAGGLSGLAADAANQLSNDPPDPNFTVVTAPTVAQIRKLKRPSHVATAILRPLETLLTVAARLAGSETALLHSIERAEGAAAVGAYPWERRQLLAGAGDALLFSDLLQSEATLRRQALRALLHAGFHDASLRAPKLRGLLRHMPKAPRGAPTTVLGLVTGSSLAPGLRREAVAMRSLAAQVTAIAGPLPAA
jgi:hypothetical protein